MLHHVLPVIFLTHRHLHASCRPAHVVRYAGMTLVMLDPSSLRAELAFWAHDHLTDAERVAIRAGYELSLDVNQPIPDTVLDGELGNDPIPASLRLPQLVPTLAAQRTA